MEGKYDEMVRIRDDDMSHRNSQQNTNRVMTTCTEERAFEHPGQAFTYQFHEQTANARIHHCNRHLP
jgi:hypothetical protein